MKTNLTSKKYLSVTQLDQRMKSLAGQERELLCEIIQTIQEIHRCKGYLELGFPNLFCYLVEGVGYSDGSAQRRIEAARLVTEVPKALEDIKSGDLKLTQVSLVQSAAREKAKTSVNPVTAKDKQEILKQITQKNFAQSQQQVAAYFDLPIKEHAKLKIQADESVRVEVTVSKELFEDMKRAQALISHAVPTADWESYLRYVTDLALKQKTKVRQLKSETVQRDKTQHNSKSAERSAIKPQEIQVDAASEISTVEICVSKPAAAKPFSTRQRKLLLSSSSGCQFRDPVTQKECRSRWFLQIDHKHSRWAGGLSDLTNAQVLCGQHNRHKYLKEAGIVCSQDRGAVQS